MSDILQTAIIELNMAAPTNTTTLFGAGPRLETYENLVNLLNPSQNTRALPVELLRDTFKQLGLKDQALFALASLHARNPTTA